MAAASQNPGTKGLNRKILRNKDLARSLWRSDGVAIASRHFLKWAAFCTAPVWAFRILSQGCSSQEAEIFLWKTVEKSERGEESSWNTDMWTQHRVPPLQKAQGWRTLCENGARKHHEGWATRLLKILSQGQMSQSGCGKPNLDANPTLENREDWGSLVVMVPVTPKL
jgi:hypothetical protein